MARHSRYSLSTSPQHGCERGPDQGAHLDVAEVGASFCGGDDVCDDGGGEGDGAAGAGGLETVQDEQGSVGILQSQPDVCG